MSDNVLAAKVRVLVVLHYGGCLPVAKELLTTADLKPRGVTFAANQAATKAPFEATLPTSSPAYVTGTVLVDFRGSSKSSGSDKAPCGATVSCTGQDYD